MLADVGRDAAEKLLAGGGLGHAADVAADQLHGVTAVAAQQAVAQQALRRAAVDDGYEVSGDDDSVLAFRLWVLGDEYLFYNLHGVDKVR